MVGLNTAIMDKLQVLSHSTLSGHYIFQREYDENYLTRRYSETDTHQRNITICISNNKKHIEQYYSLRTDAYRQIVGPGFYAGEDELDHKSHMILALAGDNCVGGIRLTFSSPDNRIDLPTEINSDFRFSKIYDRIDFTNLVYCEAGRLAFLPDFRNGSIFPQLLEAANKYGMEEMNGDLLFGRSASLQTRMFQNHCRNNGYELVIRNDIKPPKKGVEDQLIQIWAIDFTKDRKYTNILKSYNQPAWIPSETLPELEYA